MSKDHTGRRKVALVSSNLEEDLLWHTISGT